MDSMVDRARSGAGQGGKASLETGARVLRIEGAALIAFAEALDDSFARAVDLVLTASGRVVVTGIGKSGHIGNKFAATLASTGTPAYFVHPSEASHGDLGMIMRDDVVIAMSNSGATAELADIAAYTRRFGIPLIAITSRADSPLATGADVVLVVPRAEEACPMGLAPTTSTTMALGLCDALAIALLERRGFSRDDYRVLHPGGQLGRRLIKVSDVMHTGEAMPLVQPETPMSDALLVMTTKSFGCVGVIRDDGRLIGIITDGDLRRHMSSALLDSSAAAIMTHGPRTIRPSALAAEAVATMNAKAITSLFAVDDEQRPAGIVHIHDCLRAGVA